MRLERTQERFEKVWTGRACGGRDKREIAYGESDAKVEATQEEKQ